MAAAAAAAPRTYSDFVPPHKLVEEAEKKVLQIDLSTAGFKKEQLRVQIDNHGKLRISGERPVSGNRWSRFHKDFQVPDDCNAGDVRARFSSKDCILHITMPKLSPADAPPPPAAGRQEAAAVVTAGRRRKTPWRALLAVVLALVAAAGFYAKYRVSLMDPSAAPANGGGHFSGLISDH